MKGERAEPPAGFGPRAAPNRRAWVGWGLLSVSLVVAMPIGGTSPARASPGSGVPVPRVVALYDSKDEPSIRESRIHTLAEMPLNHLGLIARFHDARLGLPDAVADPEVRGVLSWLSGGAGISPDDYAEWASALLQAGKRLVVLGDFGIELQGLDAPRVQASLAGVLARLGVSTDWSYAQPAYGARVIRRDPEMMEFERRLTGPFHPFLRTRAQGAAARALLTLRDREDSSSDSDLVVLGPQGGYAGGGVIYYQHPQRSWLKWHLNPFAFFREAFATRGMPALDTTTLAGRRIYYSHVDGDGWRNVSEIEGYVERQALSPEVVLDRAIRPFPDLPVTIAPISADIEPSWYGTPESIGLARTILALPQVEAASHTHTHPFNWAFFERYEPAKERPFLAKYPELAGQTAGIISGYGGPAGKPTGCEAPPSPAIRYLGRTPSARSTSTRKSPDRSRSSRACSRPENESS